MVWRCVCEERGEVEGQTARAQQDYTQPAGHLPSNIPLQTEAPTKKALYISLSDVPPQCVHTADLSLRRFESHYLFTLITLCCNCLLETLNSVSVTHSDVINHTRPIILTIRVNNRS